MIIRVERLKVKKDKTYKIGTIIYDLNNKNQKKRYLQDITKIEEDEIILIEKGE